MDSMKTKAPYYILCYVACAIITLTALVSCSVSYKFNASNIDYTKTKTIQIADFPISQIATKIGQDTALYYAF